MRVADPVLAKRLKLSQAQRQSVYEETVNGIPLFQAAGNLMGLKESPGKLDELGRDVSVLAQQEERRLVSEADWLVWNVLTPAQLKEFNRILGRAATTSQPARGGNRKRGAAPPVRPLRDR